MIEKIIALAEEAGKMMLSGHSYVEDKGSVCNHVTDKDVEIQKFLKKKLCEILPESSFIGEEGDFSYASSLRWIVDPIDGTTNFIRLLPLSVVSIALVDGNDVLCGVVHNPYTNETFYAEKGKGAFLSGKKLKVSDRDVKKSIYATSWCAYDKSLSKKAFIISEKMFMICEDIRRLGAAAYELCKLAQGSIDIYFEPLLYPWDHAAASLIAKEAGALISGINGNPSLTESGMVWAANSIDNLKIIEEMVLKEYQSE